MVLDKKAVTTYKNTLKSMITVVSKYGITGNNSGHSVVLYHCIGDKTIHPIIIINQNVSPWGDDIIPIKGFVTPISLPTDFDLDNGGDKYKIGKKYICNYPLLKEIVDELKATSVIEIDDENNVSIFSKANTDEEKKFSAYYSESVRELMTLSKRHGFKTISDEASVDGIITRLLLDSAYTVENKEANMCIRLFSSLIPMKFDRLDYIRHLNILDTNVTSKVYLKYYVKDLQVGVFYQYLDVLEYDLSIAKEGKK
jgi:hypothetical protein